VAATSTAVRPPPARPGACSGLAAFARAALTRRCAARSDDDADDDEDEDADEVQDADVAELRCVWCTPSLCFAQL
jgi:hypothetical protein